MGLVNIDTEKLAKTLVDEAAVMLPAILDKAIATLTANLGNEARATLAATLGDIESVTITINRKSKDKLNGNTGNTST